MSQFNKTHIALVFRVNLLYSTKSIENQKNASKKIKKNRSALKIFKTAHILQLPKTVQIYGKKETYGLGEVEDKEICVQTSCPILIRYASSV